MKIIQFFILFFIGIGTLTMQGQSVVVKSKLIKIYDQVDNKALLKQLKNNYEIEDKLIENLKLKDTLFRSEFVANGNFYQAQRIDQNAVIYYQTHNFESRTFSGVNQLQNDVDFTSLKGENMWVGIIDGDLPFDRHVEFSSSNNSSSRLMIKDSWKNIGKDDEATRKLAESKRSHATHVLGTILAQGKKELAKGMAPEAKAIGYSWKNDMEKLAQLAMDGILVSNQSYGLALIGDDKQVLLPNYFLGAYVKESALLDQLSYNYPYLQPVVSAGNDRINYQLLNPTKFGMDLLVGHSTSKNAIVVGAVGQAAAASQEFWKETDFSSYGPTSDLRIKPDIVALGQGIFSSAYRYLYNGEIEKDNLYAISSGTSMASPAVAGIILLWQQYFLKYNLLPLKAASVKALMINTAKSTSYGPNGKTGWGIINAFDGIKLLDAIKNNNAIFLEETLIDNQSKKYTVEVTEEVDQLYFTISWTDVEGQLSRSLKETSPNYKALVNDLDIRIYKDDKEYFPWKLINNDFDGQAVKGDNLVDNIERIDIKLPSKGIYDVVVSHKNTLKNHRQDFSILINTNTYAGITGIKKENTESGYSDLFIWPNPTYDVLNIEIPSTFIFENKQLEIFDVSGVNVANIKIESTNRQIVDVSFLATGMYLLQIKGSGIKLRSKFIKK